MTCRMRFVLDTDNENLHYAAAIKNAFFAMALEVDATTGWS